MADSVRIVAQVAEHFFYQDYKPASAFLRLRHFIFLVIAADSKLKKDEYDGLVALNLRKRTPNAQVILNHPLIIRAEKKEVGKVCGECECVIGKIVKK